MTKLSDIRGSKDFHARNPHLEMREVNTHSPLARAFAGTYETRTNAELPDAKPERDDAEALDATVSRKEESLSRTRVCITGFRVRPLDSDNFAASVKNVVDGLRHAHLIADDDPASIVLETGQVQVPHFKDEKTIIFIDDGKP